MKKILLLLLCMPLIGLGNIETPEWPEIKWDNLGGIMVITFIVVGHLLFAILIMRAGRKLNSGSLTAAGFLYMILLFFIIVFSLETLGLL